MKKLNPNTPTIFRLTNVECEVKFSHKTREMYEKYINPEEVSYEDFLAGHFDLFFGLKPEYQKLLEEAFSEKICNISFEDWVFPYSHNSADPDDFEEVGFTDFELLGEFLVEISAHFEYATNQSTWTTGHLVPTAEDQALAKHLLTNGHLFD